ncbi:Lrp/AsnC family transcriptional regulator [Candidatus Woesearchaeota archaeon]|nr:Lrp/AsnC family transcriptional regulator [Candidatus Woesearchaeota archaeon]
MVNLDSKDLKIINILKQNSRLPIRDIAKKTQLRPSTVHLRIQKLVKNNIIEKFTLKLNNKAVEEDFIVFMFVSTSEDLPASFFNNQHIKESFGITGEYDLLLKLKFKDISQFNDYIISLRKNKSITKTITNVVTVNIKEVLN